MDVSYRAVVGMTLDQAREYLARHGLRAVVSRREDGVVPDADLTAPGAVLLHVRAARVVGIEGQTCPPVTGRDVCGSESGTR
jgi:hypothetical protein